MEFKDAYAAMKCGSKVRRHGWQGYWEWDGTTIWMHCRDGFVLDIRQTDDVNFTLSNILASDWEICG